MPGAQELPRVQKRGTISDVIEPQRYLEFGIRCRATDCRATYAASDQSREGAQKLPVCQPSAMMRWRIGFSTTSAITAATMLSAAATRSEEHTSELQSRLHLVCRLL